MSDSNYSVEKYIETDYSDTFQRCPFCGWKLSSFCCTSGRTFIESNRALIKAPEHTQPAFRKP